MQPYIMGLLIGVLIAIAPGRTAFLQAEDKSPIKIPQNERIKVSADNLTVNDEAKVAEFKGNVKAQQGNNTLRSDSLQIYYKQGIGGEDNKVSGQDYLEKIVAAGNVKIRFEDIVAVSDEAVYINKDQVLVLSGPSTKVVRGNDSITGKKITLYREGGKINVEGGEKTRVEAIFYPGEKGGIQ